MKQIKIVTDSCADIPEDILKKYDIGFIDFSIVIKGEEKRVSPNWKNFSADELYSSLREGTKLYTLAATEYEIRSKLKSFSKDNDVIYISTCKMQSVTIDKALKIANELMTSNPDINIKIIDSLNATAGQGLLVMKALELLENGLCFEDIVCEIINLRKKVIQFVTVETLTYLSKANKVNPGTAALGNIFNVKPILISDVDGRQVGIGKVRGRENSVKEVVKRFLENVENPLENDVIIIHGNDLNAAKYVEKMLIDKGFKCRNLYTLCMGAVVCISTGPGAVGLISFGKEVTFRGE